jgi:hypothetical protein
VHVGSGWVVVRGFLCGAMHTVRLACKVFLSAPRKAVLECGEHLMSWAGGLFVPANFHNLCSPSNGFEEQGSFIFAW